MNWLAIGIGAGLGACVRAWLSRFNTVSVFGDGSSWLSKWLSNWLPDWLPLGTLIANVLGGLLIGMALVTFTKLNMTQPNLWHDPFKGFIITGFLGGLTTFSTFSGEVLALLQSGNVLAGLGLIGLHVGLTLIATAIGFYAMQLVLG